MYLFLCQSICSQLCSLLIKKIGSEHLTLPVQQRVKMAWKRLHRCCGFVPTQLGGRMPLKCQVWCVSASPSRGFTGAVPAKVFHNAGPFQRDVESNCCLWILAAHMYSFTWVTTSTQSWGGGLWGRCSSSPLGRSLCTCMSTAIGKQGGKTSSANYCHC